MFPGKASRASGDVLVDFLDFRQLQLQLRRVAPNDYAVTVVKRGSHRILRLSGDLGNGLTHRFRQRAQNRQRLLHRTVLETGVYILDLDHRDAIHVGVLHRVQHTRLGIHCGQGIASFQHGRGPLRLDFHAHRLGELFGDLGLADAGNGLELLCDLMGGDQEQRLSSLLIGDDMDGLRTHPFVGTGYADLAGFQTKHRREKQQPCQPRHYSHTDDRNQHA